MLHPDRRFAFILAAQMHCTVAELMNRVSSLEFSEWQVMHRREELSPVHERVRHGQLMAAIYTGAAARKDGAPWCAAHFVEATAWPSDAESPSDDDAEPDLAAHVHAHNARLTH